MAFLFPFYLPILYLTPTMFTSSIAVPSYEWLFTSSVLVSFQFYNDYQNSQLVLLYHFMMQSWPERKVMKEVLQLLLLLLC